MKLQFLGANRQVTGSSYLLDTGDLRVLVDCGLYQERQMVPRNWQPFAFDPAKIDVLLLTHAHLDHSGLVPKLVREGFRGRIISTPPSVALAGIVMQDAAHIQEEDASFKQKRHRAEGRQGRFPTLPLYTRADADAAIRLLQAAPYQQPLRLSPNLQVLYHDAGHILGSSMLEVTLGKGDGQRTLLFSGDIGQWDKPLIPDPSVFARADYVVMESTYGDKDHPDPGSITESLAAVIDHAAAAGGNVIIPTFAIERAQELLFYLGQLAREQRSPRLMVFLDSPMAVNVTDLFLEHEGYLDQETRQMIAQGRDPLRFPGLQLCRSVAESKAINHIRGSAIILAGSGMCTGGRIKHHLVQNIGRPESVVLFVGYQGAGTLGREIMDGAHEVRILGRYWPVRARVEQLHGLSAHADRSGLFRWLGSLQAAPRQVFLTHGEEKPAFHLEEEIRRRLGYQVTVPKYRDEVLLD